MTKQKKATTKITDREKEVNEQIKKQVDKVYTDLVILAEILAEDGTQRFTINLHYAKLDFTFGKEMKK